MLEQLILADYTVASENDVEVNLWKSCFYKVIEEFRSRARKVHTVSLLLFTFTRLGSS